MAANRADDARSGTSYPLARPSRQRSLQYRRFQLYTSASGDDSSRQQHPNAGPWSKHDDDLATEQASRRHRNNYPDRPDRGAHNQRHADFENRDFDPMRPPSSPSPSKQGHGHEPIREVQIPLLHSIPSSPRWDSFPTPSSPASVTFNPISNPTPISTPTSASFHHAASSQRTRAESTPTPKGARSAFPGLSSNPFIPEVIETTETAPLRLEVRQFSLMGRHDDTRRQLVTPTSPAPSITQSAESRQSTPTEATMTTIGNFSRPRKTSIRNQKPEPPQPRHLLLNRAELESIPDQSTPTQAQFNLENSTNRWPRDRSHSPHSPSSSRSSSTSPSVHKQPSNGHLNVHSRTGSLKHPTPTPTPTTATFVRPLPTNQGNNGIFPPPSRELPPWLLSGDEFRSSFRSQTTASTLQGTLFTATGTERGSIMTKTSSITEQSIINGYARTSWRTNSMADDGPSLEDVMGMYERGFTDSDIESIRRSMRFPNEDDDDTHEIDVGTGVFGFGNSRPPSSHSEVGRMSAKMLEAMNDELPIPRARAIPMPNRSPTTDSAPTYRMSLIASSLPKDIGMGPLVAGDPLPRRNGFDSGSFEKHDSAKMLDGDDDFPMRPAGNNSVSPTMLVRSPPVPTFSTTPSPRSGTPLQTAQYPQQPLEAASSRDRYGFRKESVNVNRQQYDAWDVSYTEYLSRRRKKWVTFLKDNSLLTDNPNRFPPRSAKTKRFIRKGIPPEWRGAAWFYYAGGPAILSKHRDVYRGLVQRAALDPVGPGSIPGQTSEVKPLIIEDIEKDLHRTFPDNVRFKPPQSANEANLGQAAAGHSTFDTASETEIISSLRRVLNAFALYNPRIGYCQSLNFLAGLLLLFVETEEQAFWLLNVITRVYLPGTHEMSLEGSKVDLGVLMFVMKESMPGVWKQIGGDEADSGSGKRNRRRGKDSGSKGYANDPNRLPAITLCMTAWFMSCFIGTLPMETVLRVWDVFFYEGSRTLFRIALTIFKLAEPEIKAVTDPMEMFGVVQAFPRRLIDCNALMEACYRRRNGIGHLSQEAIEEKRQERRDGIRKWRNEQEASSVSPMIGTRESEASVGLDLATDLEAAEYRRKGTLFGKRRDREQLRAAEVI